jgi:uroporphyrin-III C-methyltransferase
MAAALMRGGLPGSTPAAVIASASLPQQQVLVSSLGNVAADARAANLAAPTLVVIGDIVSTRQRILDLHSEVQRSAAMGSDSVESLPPASAPCAS